MKYSIYKPNASSSGCAMSLNISENNDLFLNMVLQSSWDNATKTGSFKENAKNPDKTIAVKFNANEAGALINSIENYLPASFFHSYEGRKLQIRFTPWTKNEKDIAAAINENKTPPDPVRAFGINVTRNSVDQFRMPIEIGEAYVLKILLTNFINRQLSIGAESTPSE